MIIYEEIFKQLHKKKAKYALVGGIAVNLHGYIRATADLDMLIEMSDDNIAKIVTILKKEGYKVKQPVDPMSFADKKTRLDWIKHKHMKAFNFYKENEFKEVDIVIASSVPYDKVKKNIKRIKVGKTTLLVIGIDDLIKMKVRAGREVDKMDVVMLKKIKNLKRKK